MLLAVVRRGAVLVESSEEAMKRSRLTRRTPMKRTKPLRKMSAKKASRMPMYRAMVKYEIELQRVRTNGPNVCLRCKEISDVEPHHTQDRIGDSLFVFVLICRRCHSWIHTHTKLSRKEGWLKP